MKPRNAALLSIVMAAACAGETTAPPHGPVASLRLSAGDSLVNVGATVTLSAEARDSQGVIIPGAQVTWLTRDGTTATVAGGVVTGAAPGLVWVVAQSGAAADSVRLRVRTASIAVGRVHVRLRGAATVQAEWDGYGRYTDLLMADTGETSFLEGRYSGSNADSQLTLALPGRLSNGRTLLDRYVPGAALTAPVAFLILDGPGASDLMFFAGVPGGTLDVASADYPNAPGHDFGVLRAVLAFRAVRLVAGPGGQPVETTDTVDVHAEFAARLYHRLRPYVTLTLGGDGPLTGSGRTTYGEADEDGRGGLVVQWWQEYDGLPGVPDVVHEFRTTATAAASIPLAPFTPSQWLDPALWPAHYSAAYFAGDPRLALSTGGTLNITRYLAPTAADYGEIHGTLTTSLALWDGETTVSADTVTATATFAVQIWPLAGIPTGLEAVSPRTGWNLEGSGATIRRVPALQEDQHAPVAPTPRRAAGRRPARRRLQRLAVRRHRAARARRRRSALAGAPPRQLHR